MNRSIAPFSFAVALVVIGACGGKVEAVEGSGGGGAVAANDPVGSGSGSLDQQCYDACLAKNLSVADCKSYCSDAKGGAGGKGSGKDGNGGTSSGGRGGSSGDDDPPGDRDGDGKLDPSLEKPCVSCLYDVPSGSSCQAKANTCRASLACTQLQWCPVSCGGPGCFDECNKIIPTGVAPLRALVQCMACNAGPCATACQGSVMLSYCN